MDELVGTMEKAFYSLSKIFSCLSTTTWLDWWQSAATWLAECMEVACRYMHACMHTSIPIRQVIVTNPFKWSQKILCTIKRARSLEKLYGFTRMNHRTPSHLIYLGRSGIFHPSITQPSRTKFASVRGFQIDPILKSVIFLLLSHWFFFSINLFLTS